MFIFIEIIMLSIKFIFNFVLFDFTLPPFFEMNYTQNTSET